MTHSHSHQPPDSKNPAQRIVHTAWFRNGITGVILFAALLVGLETDPTIVGQYGTLLHALDKVVLAIFTAEIILKLVAETPRPLRYFRDGWNVFDFLIVVVAFLPFHAEYATVLRLLRLLRVLRLVRALPRLQILVNALLKSIPSMGYVSLFLAMHFYVYAVAGVFMFGANDPVRFGSLPTAALTLFTVVTMEGWADVMYTQMKGCAAFGYEGIEALCTHSQASPLLSPVYFITFILLGTMIILNLFIGVIMSGMQEAQEEAEALDERERLEKTASEQAPPSLQHQLHELHKKLEHLTEESRRIRDHAERQR